MKRLTALLFILLLMRQLPAQVNPCNRTRPDIPYSTLPGDTTVVYPNGTRLTFNRCEFFDIRNCLTVTEAYTLQDITRAGFTTYTDRGDALITGGMLKINVSPSCNGRNCFEVPVKVVMPLLANLTGCARCDSLRFRLYTTSNSLWSDTNSIPVRTFMENGRPFIEFFVTCPNFGYNWDCKVPAVKVKFKAKHIAALQSVTITGECPFMAGKWIPKRNKRKVIAKIPCFDNPATVLVSAKGYAPDGDTTSFGPVTLSRLKHVQRMKNCKKQRPKGPVIRRILGIFPVRKGAVYRKYFIE